MEKQIWIRSLESFEVSAIGESEILGEVHEGQVYSAELYEETEEYFIKDELGREIYVGEIDESGALRLDVDIELVKTIKFSNLRPGQYIQWGEEVITQEKALEIHKQGPHEQMYAITDEYIDSILHQVYEDGVKGIDKEKYTAPNDGMLIIFDE